jgi:DNA-binding LytR/AlgR family response regulator
MARTERKAVLLQLYPTILDQIAGEIAKSPVRMSRQTWVELAIVEKLRRDQG